MVYLHTQNTHNTHCVSVSVCWMCACVVCKRVSEQLSAYIWEYMFLILAVTLILSLSVLIYCVLLCACIDIRMCCVAYRSGYLICLALARKTVDLCTPRETAEYCCLLRRLFQFISLLLVETLYVRLFCIRFFGWFFFAFSLLSSFLCSNRWILLWICSFLSNKYF